MFFRAGVAKLADALDLGSQVDQTSANLISAQLILLAAEDPEKDVSLYINPP